MQHFLQLSEDGLAHHHHPPYLNEIEDLRDGLVADISPDPSCWYQGRHTRCVRMAATPTEISGFQLLRTVTATAHRRTTVSSRHIAVPSFDRAQGCQTTGAPISMACRLAGSVHFIRNRSTASLPSAAVTVS